MHDSRAVRFFESIGNLDGRLGQTEIEKLGPRLGQHHVARLQCIEAILLHPWGWDFG